MSKFATKIKGYYDRGLWSASQVRDAYMKGRITAEELYEITGDDVSADGDDEEDYSAKFYGLTASAVLESLHRQATLKELRQACDWLQIEWDVEPRLTRAELRALIDAAAQAESEGE